MAGGRIAVRPWNSNGPVPEIRGELLVLSVATPPTASRDHTRQQVRQAVRAILAPALACTPAEVPLLSRAGQPLRLDLSGQTIGLSLSHEAGLSLLAINPQGPVGVDLLKLEQLPLADAELPRLATDYLGPQATRGIAGRPAEQRRQAFATAWVEFEARLKCLGEGLEEWSATRQAMLDRCAVRELGLPVGWVGAVAVLGKAQLTSGASST